MVIFPVVDPPTNTLAELRPPRYARAQPDVRKVLNYAQEHCITLYRDHRIYTVDHPDLWQ